MYSEVTRSTSPCGYRTRPIDYPLGVSGKQVAHIYASRNAGTKQSALLLWDSNSRNLVNPQCFILLYVVTVCASGSGTYQFEDLRCKCTCLSFPKYNLPARVYTGGVVSSKCDCLDFIVPALNATIMKKADLEPYCLRCDCKYEVRSTKTMEVVVCLFIVLIGILVTYMVFMLAVDPIMSLTRKKITRRNEDESPLMMMQESSTSESQGGKSVFQRVNLVQSRWKKQVEEQRSNVFEKQDMLQ